MKYTFESSDKETTAFLNFLGLAVHEITALARYSIKQSTKRRMHEPKTSHGVATLTLVGDVDESADSTDCEGPGEDCSVLPFPTKPVPSPQQTTEGEREDTTVYETETIVRPDAPPADSKLDKASKKGRAAFHEFISEWLVGIDRDTMGLIDDIKQPDRAQMLRDLHNGPHSYGVLLFVKKCGGLISAVADVTGNQTLALALAPFIVPPASITFGDLADTYEYANPFKKDEE
jgi:hypothetical protein